MMGHFLVIMDFVRTKHFGCRSCRHLGREVNQTPVPAKEGHMTSTFWEQGNLAACKKYATHVNNLRIRHH